MKRRIAAKGEPTRVTAFQFYQQFFILFLQPFEHAWIQNHTDIMNTVLVLAHDSVESPMQFYARGHGRFYHAASAAVGTILVNRVTQALLRSLTGHFHQPELRNGEDMCLGFVTIEPFLHQAEDCLLVSAALHINEIGYDQSADIA